MSALKMIDSLARRERLSRMGILEEPMGYVDGRNLYQFVGSDPVGLVDPMGLEIEYVGNNTPDAIKRFNRGKPVEILSEQFYAQFVNSHGYGGTGMLEEVRLKAQGEPRITEIDCHIFEATREWVAVGKLGSTTDVLVLKDAATRNRLADNLISLALVDAAIAAVNAQTALHEKIRADIWKSVYAASYSFSARGGTAEEARQNLLDKEAEEVQVLQNDLLRKQRDLYNNTFADRLRDRDWDVLGGLMDLLGEQLPAQRPR